MRPVRARQRGVTILEFLVLGAVLVLGSVYAVSAFRDSAQSSLETAGEVVAQVGAGDTTAGERYVGTPPGGEGGGGPISPSTEPLEADDSPGFWGNVWGVAKGIGEGAVDLVGGVVDLGHGLYNISPIRATYDFEGWKQSWSNLGDTAGAIANDPMLLVDAIVAPIKEDWSEGRYGEAIGRGIFEVAGIVFGTKGVDKVAKGSKVGRVAGVVDDVPPAGGLNLFKWGDETSTIGKGWKEGDHFLYLPNKGSPKANWAQNSSRLREAMRKGEPIYDSYRDPVTGLQKPTTGFLNAERKLLESHGWTYNPKTGAYHPPD